jgi:hypothetical protein
VQQQGPPEQLDPLAHPVQPDAGLRLADVEAAAVVLDSSLDRLDELMHIGRRMRRIAMQTAIGGIVLSSIGMVLAVFGLLPPIAGAVAQEWHKSKRPAAPKHTQAVVLYGAHGDAIV